MSALLAVEQVSVRFGGRLGGRGTVQAVDAVDLEVQAGEVLAVVGESGSGKTTLGRCMLGLLEPTEGRVVLDGVDVRRRGRRGTGGVPTLAQPVFQDPYASLDPRWPAGRTIREALDAQRIGDPPAREARVRELLGEVGLPESVARRRPRDLSGGQRQRVAIAAALATRPRLIVADEPVSALDMLVQAQILNLVDRLRAEHDLAIVFITHDLGVVRHLADRVAVMQRGRLVEQGSVDEVFGSAQHPHTHELLAADLAPPVPATAQE